MRADRYKIDVVTKANFENPGMTPHELAKDSGEPYAIRCYCTQTVTDPDTGSSATKLGIAYYIPSEGRLVADLNDSPSTNGLVHLATYCLKSDDAWEAIKNLGELLQDYEFNLPEAEREQVFIAGFEKMEEVKNAAANKLPIDPSLVSPPVQQKKAHAAEHQSTTKKAAATQSPILKNDTNEVDKLTAVISLTLMKLPSEHQHKYQLIVCKVIEPLATSLHMLSADDATAIEKANAKENIKTALKALTSIFTANSAAQKAAQALINKICNHLFSLYDKGQLIEKIASKLNEFLSLLISSTVIKDLVTGEKPEKIISAFILDQLDIKPTTEKSDVHFSSRSTTPVSTPTSHFNLAANFIDSSIDAMKETIVRNVVRSALAPKAEESIEVLARRLSEKELEGKTAEEQMHLMIAKQAEIRAGRAVMSETGVNYIAVELNAIQAQLRYQELILEQESRKARTRLSSIFSSSTSVSNEATLREVRKLQRDVADMQNNLRQNVDISQTTPMRVANPKLADIVLQVNAAIEHAARHEPTAAKTLS